MSSQVHFSAESDEWATPPEILRPLSSAVGGFDLDPCSGAEERTIAAESYTEADDGLAQPWFGNVWVNPPYSDIEAWTEKMVDESYRDDVDRIISIVPSRTDTQWWHNYALRADVITFIEGRVSFGDADNSAPFPSAFLIWGDMPLSLRKYMDVKGAMFRARIGTKQSALSDL